MHPVYKKFIMRSKNYAAHDENNLVKAGDEIRIEESRPISRRKRWVALFDGAPPATPGEAEKPARKAKAKAARPSTKARAPRAKKKAASRAKAEG